MPAFVRRIGVVLASVVMALVLAETAFRVLAWREDRAIVERLTSAAPGPFGGRNVSLGDLIHLVDDPDVVYRHWPGITGARFIGVDVRTNAHGFRGPELDPAKPPGTVRVVGIGDSTMFGWGVREEEGYLVRLVAALNAADGGTRFEAVNTAVSGYNLVMEVATLERYGLAFEPDLVVVGLVSNDLSLPSFVRLSPPVTSLRESFLLRRLRGERHDGGFVETAGKRGEEAGFEVGSIDPADAPPQYAHLVGWEAFDRALDRLGELARAHGFEVVVTTMHGYRLAREMLAHAEARGFTTLIPVPNTGQLLKERGAKTLFDAGLAIAPNDPHPSAELHARCAELLAEHLEDAGILERISAAR